MAANYSDHSIYGIFIRSENMLTHMILLYFQRELSEITNGC